MRTKAYGELPVTIYDDAEAMGRAAADDFAATAAELLAERDEISVIFATGNSQATFRAAIAERDDIQWHRINVLHLDEYLGVSADLPESTVWRMQHDIVDVVHPKAFYPFRGENDPDQEVLRYTEILQRLKPEICVLGVGENGHLAFNDPPADFDTENLIEIVTLSEASRRQILGEGRFGSFERVPQNAVTMTVPALLAPQHVIVIVPDRRKAESIRATLEGAVTPECPGSILQTAAHARMYLDSEAASLLRQV